MNRDKPLWEIYVVEGLQGGRGALIVKVHHSLADGIAGASMLRIMLDPTPEGSHAIRKPHFHPPAPNREPSLTDAIASAIHSSLENLVAAEAGLLDIAHGLLSDRTQQGLQGLMSLLPEILTPVQRLPFNKQCGGERKFCWAEFDFADVKAIRNATGGTVNDVILTVVTRAVARYAKLHRESVAGRFLRMVCPVSVRKDEQGDALGNRISFLPVTLPMDAEDPVQHLKAIALRTAIMKSAQAAELLAIAASWLGAAPPPAQALFWWGIPLVPLPAPLLNLICTNVPGSPTPLYSVGKRMLSSYPQVPTGYELGVGVAVQSYNGKMCFGLNADAVAAADVRRLRDFIRTSWVELRRAAGVRPAPHRSEAKGAMPVPQGSEAEGTKPAPQRSEAERTKPAPHRSEAKGAMPVPHRSEAERTKPVPHRSEAEGAMAVPQRSEAERTEPAPHRSEAEGTRQVPKTRAPRAARVAVLKPAAAPSPAPSPVAAPEPEPEPVKEFAPAVQEMEAVEFA
jgi:WS/DGAT/MGAT family acyltransferase